MANLKGRLKPVDEKKIQKNYELLLNELDGKELGFKMFSREIFDLDTLEEIKNANPNTQKHTTEVFLDKLFRSGRTGYTYFLEALKANYSHVIDILESTDLSLGPSDVSSESSKTMTSVGDTGLLQATAGLHVKDVPVKERRFTIVNTISSKMNDDTEKPAIVDVTVLKQEGGDVIVVCDSRNVCVKSFWFDQLKDREFSSRLPLDEKSGSVGKTSKINEYRIAVACSMSCEIYIVGVSPGLSVHSTIHTQTRNWSICAITSHSGSGNETRFVTGHLSGISVIDMEGVVIKQMDIDIAGRKYTHQPMFLTLTPAGNILVSDRGTSLLCITQKREVLWRYAMTRPVGVHCDAQGNVFVADFIDNCVIVLSADGKFIKEVISSTDHMACPHGICYDSNRGRLYIAEESSGNIKIFEHN